MINEAKIEDEIIVRSKVKNLVMDNVYDHYQPTLDLA